MRKTLQPWFGRARAALVPGPRLGLGLMCGLAVLIPSLLAAELFLRGLTQVQVDDARGRSLNGLDSVNGLVQQESVRVLDNAQLVAERVRRQLAEDPSGDLVQAVTDARAALRSTSLVAVVDGSGRIVASDPATNLPLAADGQTKAALGGKPSVGLANRIPLAIEAAAPLGAGDLTAAVVVALNLDDGFLNAGLRLSGLDMGLVQNVQNTPRLVAASRNLRRSVSVAQDTVVGAEWFAAPADEFQRTGLGAESFWLASRPLQRVNGVPIGVFLVGLPVESVDVPIGQARLWADGAVAAATLVTTACGMLLGGSIARRLRRLVSSARRLADDSATPSAPAERVSGDWGAVERTVREASVRVSALLASERFRTERLEAVLASLAEGVIVADAERDVVLVNPAARALLDGNVVRERERIIRSYSAPVVTQNAGQPLGTVTVFRDATREQELDRLKSEFLTVVSHELQTPLTAIKGALELVLDDDSGQLSRVQRRFLDTIERNSTRLIGLVGDLLDMSRLEAGGVELIPRPLDTPSVVRAVAAALANLFDARNIVVDVEVAESTPPILGDRRRVEQILTNLLANAAKYTPPGGKVQVSAAGTETHVTLAVTDSGPGVPEFERDFVFDKFYRGPEAVRRGDAGSGLGLAIVKSLVELHGGDVCLESPHNGVGGHGARFVVNLPRATEEE
jgi:two-component system phosphate regulon sensor histidine kinase PhoR